MSLSSLKRASLKKFTKYVSLLVGNAKWSDAAYEPLGTVDVSSSVANVVINSTANWANYKHLQIRYSAKSAAATDVTIVMVRFNADAGTNYSRHIMLNEGAYGYASNDYASIGYVAGSNSSASQFSAGVADILDAFSSTKNKATRALAGGDPYYVHFHSSAWYNTAPITSITILLQTGNIAANSRFSLYGLRA